MVASTLRWVLVAGLFLQAGVLRAEGGCPPGYYPIGAPQGQQGPQGCAPIPGGDNALPPEPPPPPPSPIPPLEWKPDWGSVALDPEHGAIGSAVEALTRAVAENGALDDCHSNGGTACRIAISYENGCAALAASDAAWAVEYGDTEVEAGVRALGACAETGRKKCRVKFKECSRPNGIGWR